MHRYPIELVRLTAPGVVSGEICSDITDDHLKKWRADWVPVASSIDWDWEKIVIWARLYGGLAKQMYSIVAEDKLEGMMVLDTTQPARLPQHQGRDLVYVDFVAAAPLNRRAAGEKRVFSGIGPMLIRTAVEQSIDLGFKGRIGLHSLPDSEEFYAVHCSMIPMGKDAKKENLTYYEMTEDRAQRFLL